MAVAHLVATARPEGNRIDLLWTNPDEATLPSMRVVRREGAYPTHPDPGLESDGLVVADTDPAVGAPRGIVRDGDRHRVADTGLRTETVYYYRLFPYAGSPPAYELDPVQRVSAMATGPYGFGALMAELLPGVYRRYDTVLPADVLPPDVVAAMAPGDRDRGQLARFLDLVGGLFDQHYSAVRSLRDLRDPDRVDGRLLPLLAEWIGWSSDFHLGYDGQRREIRAAPAIYRVVETVPTVEATVRRIAGWETRSKEFVDNVAASNRPERLNIWLADEAGGAFQVADATLLSLDHAHSGRPVSADVAGSTRLLYHTRKGGRWDIWQKTHTVTDGWQGSAPVVNRAGTTDTDPAVAVQDGTLWLFWSAYDHANDRWRIDFRTETAGTWAPISTLRVDETDPTERRAPAATVDADGALWLFWWERVDRRWTLRHQRFDTAPWAPSPAVAFDFPLDGTEDPRVEADLFVLARDPQGSDPSDPFRRIWVLWAREDPVPGSAPQTRWRIVSRVKDGSDPSDPTDWSAIAGVSVADPLDHDREPAAAVDPAGDIDVVWSATRDGSWSVWRTTIDAAAHTWGAATPVTGAPFSERSPAVVDQAGTTTLLYRSNRSVEYTSETFRGTQTVDRRYSGSTTVATANAVKTGLRTRFGDFATYTYDTGTEGSGSPGERTDDDWYARDTLGLYLEPDTLDPVAGEATRSRLRRVLPEFMPATDRAVFVDGEPGLHVDFFYGYGNPGADAPPSIGEGHRDELVAVGIESLVDDGDFSDGLEP